MKDKARPLYELYRPDKFKDGLSRDEYLLWFTERYTELEQVLLYIHKDLEDENWDRYNNRLLFAQKILKSMETPSKKRVPEKRVQSDRANNDFLRP